jgi:hypothetical protein
MLDVADSRSRSIEWPQQSTGEFIAHSKVELRAPFTEPLPDRADDHLHSII